MEENKELINSQEKPMISTGLVDDVKLIVERGLREASQEMWSVRTLSRNIGSQYYYRLLQSPKKDKVIAEMQELTRPLQQGKDEIVKNPVVAEFLGLENTDYSETDLEQAIINHLQKFIMEMGRGFALVGRQKRIVTETADYSLT